MGGIDDPLSSIPAGMKSPGSMQPLPKIAVPTDIDHTLDLAGEVNRGLQGKLLANVIGTLGDTAGVASALAAKSELPIRDTLGRAAQALLALHGPLQNDIVGNLGAAMETGLRLGVVPPTPGNEPIMPAAVQIRAAATAGDLGPALEQYRLTAAPYEGVGGLDYAKAMQSIMAALGDGQGIQNSFLAAVAQMRQPHSGGNLPSVQPTDPAVDCRFEADRKYQNALRQCQVTTGGLAPAVNACNLAAYNAYLADLAACGVVVSQGPGTVGSVPGASTPVPTIGQLPGGQLPGGTSQPAIPTGSQSSSQPSQSPGSPLQSVPGSQSPAPQSPPGVVPPITIPEGTPFSFPPLGTGQDSSGGSGGQSPPPPGLNVPEGQGGSVGMAPPPPGMGQQPGITGGTPMGLAPPGMGVQPQFFPPPSQGSGAMPATPEPPLPPPPIVSQCAPGQTWVPPDEFGNGGCVVTGGGTPQDGGLTPEQAAAGCVPIPPEDQLPPPVTCPVGFHIPPAKPTEPQVTPVVPPPPVPPTNKPEFKGGIGVIEEPGIDGCADFPPVPALKMPGGFADFSELLGLKNSDGTPNGAIISGEQTGVVKTVSDWLIGTIVGIVDTFGGLGQKMLKDGECIDDDYIALTLAAAVVGIIRTYIGVDIRALSVPNEQQRNYKCPTALPQPPDAAIAWMGDQISDETLECWVRAAGVRFPEYKKVIDGMRSKFPLMQLGSLFLRGQIGEQELADRIRESGFTRDEDMDDLRELLKVIPPPSDLVRFMVRDTADNALVNKFGMDDEFQAKFAGNLKDWAKASGVSDEYMQSVWRAHWSIPAPGQLMDFLHRSAELPITDPAYTDLDDVETALKQQDILPYWLPRFLNSSYNLLGRIDLRRGFQLGVIDREKLVEKYRVAGYREDDANTLADVTEATTLATFRRSPLVGQLAGGAITDEEFEEGLSADGATTDMIATARKRALTIAQSKMRKRCTDAYHKRYLLGDLEIPTARSSLLQLGISADIVGTIISGWQCERDSRGRAIPAGELASLYGMGAITASDLTRRLQRIGYSYEDAVLLTRRIADSQNQKISKQESADIRKQEAENKRLEKGDAAAAKQAVATAQRAQKRVVALNRVNTLRTKRLLESGGKFSTNSGLDLSSAAATVQSVYQRTLQEGGWLPDEIIAAIATAVADKTITDAAALAASVRNMLVVSIPNYQVSDGVV